MLDTDGQNSKLAGIFHSPRSFISFMGKISPIHKKKVRDHNFVLQTNKWLE